MGGLVGNQPPGGIMQPLLKAFARISRKNRGETAPDEP